MTKTMNSFEMNRKAVQELIKSSFTGEVAYTPVDQAFDYALKQVSNKGFKFPYISIYHTNNYDIDMSRNSFPSYMSGKLFENSIPARDDNNSLTGEVNENKGKSVQNLYIHMRYIIDVWGTDRVTTEIAATELLFWLFANQSIDIMYDGHKLKMSFSVEPSLIDNTDLSQYSSNGKLYRMSISITLNTSIFRSTEYFTVRTPQIEILSNNN